MPFDSCGGFPPNPRPTTGQSRSSIERLMTTVVLNCVGFLWGLVFLLYRAAPDLTGLFEAIMHQMGAWFFALFI